MTQNTAIIGERVRAVRIYLRLSGQEFARSLDTTKQALSLIENGKRSPSAAFLWRIAHEHHIDVRYLYGQIDEMSPGSAEATHPSKGESRANEDLARVLPEISHELHEIRSEIAKIPSNQSARTPDPHKQSLLVQIVSLALKLSSQQLTRVLEFMSAVEAQDPS